MTGVPPHHRELLEGWKAVAGRTATGPGFDLTETNPTVLFQQRSDHFLADPSTERFRDLWNDETLVDSRVRTAGLVLNRWEGTIEELAALLHEMWDAETFDTAWTDGLPKQISWEVFSRFHPEQSPIVSSHVGSALAQLGYEQATEYADGVEQTLEFREVYQSVAGHVTQGNHRSRDWPVLMPS